MTIDIRVCVRVAMRACLRRIVITGERGGPLLPWPQGFRRRLSLSLAISLSHSLSIPLSLAHSLSL